MILEYSLYQVLIKYISNFKIILDHIVEIQRLQDELKAEQTIKKKMAQEIDSLTEKLKKPLSSDFGIQDGLQSVSGTN